MSWQGASLPSLHLRLQFNDYAWWESDAARRASTAAALAEAVEALKACRTNPRWSPHLIATRPHPVPVDA